MTDPAQPQDNSAGTMFLILVACVAIFLAIWYLRPHTKPADELGASNSGSASANEKDEQLRRLSDQMRKDYIETFGKGLPSGMSADQIQGALRDELGKMEGNPGYSDDQRAKVKQMLGKFGK